MDPHRNSPVFPGLFFRPVTLGDKLQLLARIAPSDLRAITIIVDDVLHERLRALRDHAISEAG